MTASLAESVFSSSMVAQTLRMSLPYVCAALGGVMCERSGVVNVALEGTLVASALGAIAATQATGSAVVGVLAGVVTGAVVGLVHASLAVRARIDAIVSGIALNLVASGGTRFVTRALYGSSSNSPTVAVHMFGASLFGDGHPVLAAAFNPLFLLAAACVAAIVWLLRDTRFGLHVRACGEDPTAAQVLGVRVDFTRMIAVVLGGAVTGVGGTALAFDLHQFQAGMSGGRGFVALAAVIVAGWRPWQTAAACVAFAALDALQIVLQNQTTLPADGLAMMPFVATLVALVMVGAVSRGEASSMRAPAGIGKHP